MHTDSVVPKSERRSLRYDFTAVETHDLSLKLAAKTREQASVTEEKKSVMSQYSATLNELKAQCNKLSNQVSDGWEMRDVDCDIEFNKPEQGKKTLTRRDTQQQIIERMEPWEWNLFTSVTADDLLPPAEPVKEKKPRRGKKQSTDILDEVESMGDSKPHRPPNATEEEEIIGDTDENNPDDLPFL